jgi:5-methylcytosine-specific restriction protein A
MPTIKLSKTKRRPTYNKAGYQKVYNTPRWKRLRAEKVANNPVCELCAAKGITRVVEEVHHLVPFEIDNDLSLAYDYDNLISLCVECHKQLHMDLKGGRFSPHYINQDIEYR